MWFWVFFFLCFSVSVCWNVFCVLVCRSLEMGTHLLLISYSNIAGTKCIWCERNFYIFLVIFSAFLVVFSAPSTVFSAILDIFSNSFCSFSTYFLIISFIFNCTILILECQRYLYIKLQNAELHLNEVTICWIDFGLWLWCRIMIL